MRFAAPEYLGLLALVPLGALLIAWSRARRRRALQRFSGGPAFVARFDREVSVHRRAVKGLLVLAVLLALPLALARPQWGTQLESVKSAGADVVIVVDASLSMAAEDLAPSRLGQAKHAVDRLLRRLEGHRVALVTFAGRANVLCPLTVDHGAVRLFVESLEVGSVSVPGTGLGEALDLALVTLRSGDAAAVGDRGHAIVLFTDGEDHEGSVEDALSNVKDAGVPVHAVGCGTARGAPIALRGADGVLQGYKKDREDKIVTSRLSEPILEQIALESGGRYYRASPGELEIDEIARSLTALQAGELSAELRTRYRERFQVPLLFAWLALLVESILGDRRSRPDEEPS